MIPTMDRRSSTKKSVGFAPFASKISLPLDENPASLDSMWYDKAEMHKLARADVAALVAQDKKTTKSSSSDSDSNDHDEGDHIHPAEQEESVVVCRRGLEMYMAGELTRRQRRRKAFTYVLLQKQEVLLTLENDKNEIAERLRRFSEIRSKKCRDEARSLGVQDALDAARAALVEVVKKNYDDDNTAAATNSVKPTSDKHSLLQVKTSSSCSSADTTTSAMTTKQQMLTQTFDALVGTKMDTGIVVKSSDSNQLQTLTETMRNTSIIRAA